MLILLLLMLTCPISGLIHLLLIFISHFPASVSNRPEALILVHGVALTDEPHLELTSVLPELHGGVELLVVHVEVEEPVDHDVHS